jgi:hypothetical protein
MHQPTLLFLWGRKDRDKGLLLLLLLLSLLHEEEAAVASSAI